MKLHHSSNEGGFDAISSILPLGCDATCIWFWHQTTFAPNSFYTKQPLHQTTSTPGSFSQEIFTPTSVCQTDFTPRSVYTTHLRHHKTTTTTTTTHQHHHPKHQDQKTQHKKWWEIWRTHVNAKSKLQTPTPNQLDWCFTNLCEVSTGPVPDISMAHPGFWLLGS